MSGGGLAVALALGLWALLALKSVVQDTGVDELAKVYGVDEADLGQFYASRTLLKREVLPEHVAAAAHCARRLKANQPGTAGDIEHGIFRPRPAELHQQLQRFRVDDGLGGGLAGELIEDPVLMA